MATTLSPRIGRAEDTLLERAPRSLWSDARRRLLRNRAAIFGIAPPGPKTTSLGLEVTRTFTIHQAELDDGFVHYELLEDDRVIWSGLGNDPVEGLLQLIIRITEGEDPDHPNT